MFHNDSLEWRGSYLTTLDDIAATIVEKHNSVVKDEDTTIIVGDIGKPCQETLETLNKLKGHKILILGNHDEDWNIDILKKANIFEYIATNMLSNGIFIQHTPDFVIPSHLQSVMYYIHGHHHVYSPSTMRNELLSYAHETYRYNCCVDQNGLKPCTLQELMLNKAITLDKYL